MRNKIIQNKSGKYRGENAVVKNDPHKEFVEELKKQVLSDETETTDRTSVTEAEVKFDELFADLDDND